MIKQFVKNSCKSLYSENNCEEAWGLIPKTSMEHGAPGTVFGNCALQKVCDIETTTCISSSESVTECECRYDEWSLIIDQNKQFCEKIDVPVTDDPVTDDPVTTETVITGTSASSYFIITKFFLLMTFFY